MIVWIGILIWTIFVSLTWKYWFIVKKGIRNGREYVRPTFISLFISQLPMVVLIGFRTGDIGDTLNYINSFNNINFSWSEAFFGDINARAFYIFQGVIKMIYPNASFYLLVVAIVQMALILYIIKDYSEMPGISLFLFVASVEFCYMFNGIRQFFAITIIFAGFKLLKNKKYFWYVLIILLAAQFHSSAYVMLIALVVSFIKPFSRWMYVAIIGFSVAMIFLDPILSGMQIFLEDTEFESRMNIMANAEGVNVLRFIVAAIPCILAFIFRKNKELVENRTYAIVINLTFIYAGFMLASSIAGGLLLARFAEYFSIYLLISYPAIFKLCFKGNTRTIVVAAFGVLYCFWFYYQMFMNWNMHYESSVLGLYF
ncbi:MAG: EpsG family protein [Acutalibacteraceae bacterium]